MNRRAGYTVLEMAVALTFLTVGILAFFTAFYSSLRAGQDTGDVDRARVALENASELIRTTPFDTAYAVHHGSRIPVPGLTGPNGLTAEIAVDCFVNETAIPAEFGPVLDIDGSGGLDNPNCSLTYKILPVRLSLAYTNVHGTRTRQVFLLLKD
jgi:hypothetical protein